MQYIVGQLVIVMVFVLFIWGYYGGFNRIDIGESVPGGEIIVYKKVTGSYKKTPTHMNEVYDSLMAGFNIQTTKGVAVYYDAPDDVAEENLRSDVGCVIDDIEAIDQQTMTKIRQLWHVEMLPVAPSVVVEVPSRGKISVVVNMFRVHSKIKRYISSQGYQKGALTEIYDMNANKIIYRQRIDGGGNHTEVVASWSK